MTGETYVPTDRTGWWGKPDTRVRCRMHGKVVFTDEASAQRSADKATARGTAMGAYEAKCGHWHTTRLGRRRRF